MKIVNSLFQRQGFVLVIVLGILGLLAMLAMMFVGKAALSVQVAAANLEQSRARMASRSGVEVALRHHLEPADLIRFEGQIDSAPLALIPPGEGTRYVVTLEGTSSRINVNDGIRAGALEIGPGYNAAAVDP